MISDTRCLYLGLLSSYIIVNAGAWMAKWSGSLKLELAIWLIKIRLAIWLIKIRTCLMKYLKASHKTS
jgi:hypothetical protein